MKHEVLLNWLEVHEWRKRLTAYDAQRALAAEWWWAARGSNSITRARARRARRFIRAHGLHMVDVLCQEVNLEYFLRDANKVGARTRATMARLRKPHPGRRPVSIVKRVA